MPETDLGFDVPTLPELQEQTADDLNFYLDGEDARLPRTEPYALAHMTAGAVRGAYGFQRFLAAQILPDRASVEYMERWASIFGLTRTPANQAAGDIDITGTNGATAPTGTQWQSADGSQVWAQTAPVTIAGGVGTVGVQAVEAGTDGNATVGTVVVIASPIAGINDEGVVAAGGLTGGLDQETDDSLRTRLLERIRDTPQGGSEADYVAWAKTASTSAPVNEVWVTDAEYGGGTVGIRFSLTVPSGGDATDAIPSLGPPTDASLVAAAIDAERPVTADVTVVGPTAQGVAFNITLVPNTPSVQAAVEAEINALFIQSGEPGGTIYLSQIDAAISAASGEEYHVLNAPAANVVIGADNLPTITLPIVFV
jgi:uncharacterized phage protein gp47/JayE